jgi:hypothetical protein
MEHKSKIGFMKKLITQASHCQSMNPSSSSYRKGTNSKNDHKQHYHCSKRITMTQLLTTLIHITQSYSQHSEHPHRPRYLTDNSSIINTLATYLPDPRKSNCQVRVRSDPMTLGGTSRAIAHLTPYIATPPTRTATAAIDTVRRSRRCETT